jgi:hypothetical protein
VYTYRLPPLSYAIVRIITKPLLLDADMIQLYGMNSSLLAELDTPCSMDAHPIEFCFYLAQKECCSPRDACLSSADIEALCPYLCFNARRPLMSLSACVRRCRTKQIS